MQQDLFQVSKIMKTSTLNIMKYLLIFLTSISVLLGIIFFKKKEVRLVKNDVVQLKEKIKYIGDTISIVEVRLQKAKKERDTITILKTQDTIIKFQKIEIRLQDTLIKKQDTIIIEKQDSIKKLRFKNKLSFGLGFAAGFVTGAAVGGLSK
jgi:hypothetical protein